MKEILDSFKIKVDFIEVCSSDNFDVYSLRLSLGQKKSRVDSCLIDIGLSLRSYSAPTGDVSLSDGRYNISIQKNEMQSYGFSEITAKHEFGSEMRIPLILGVDSYGNLLDVDLSRLPNLLIGGVPGSGKSMLIHSIILSLIKNSCDIYLCDPKLVEFSAYKNIGCIKKITNDVEDTKVVAEHLVSEMNRRFDLLRRKGARDIFEYNEGSRVKIKPVVMVIDEWADLTLKDSSIESSMCMLAQKGRAAGISVIIATQRPSAKVISGLIKSSFSGRICLKVNSSIDSRIVIDTGGAESIIDVGAGMYRDQKRHTPVTFRSLHIDNLQHEISMAESCGKRDDIRLKRRFFSLYI
jgi:S-DNA-T family DNA segregation ATPase FtsK/SpoIIIE